MYGKVFTSYLLCLLNIGTRQLLTILVLKFEQTHFYYLLTCQLKTASWMANSVDPDQKLQNAASNQGQHFLAQACLSQ